MHPSSIAANTPLILLSDCSKLEKTAGLYGGLLSQGAIHQG